MRRRLNLSSSSLAFVLAGLAQVAQGGGEFVQADDLNSGGNRIAVRAGGDDEFVLWPNIGAGNVEALLRVCVGTAFDLNGPQSVAGDFEDQVDFGSR